MPRQWDLSTTICAIASGNQPAPRGVLRMTGPEAVAISQQFVQATYGKLRPGRNATSIDDPELGQLPVDLWVWPNQHSYTGQPTCEWHMIGSLPLLHHLLQRLCQAGAVPAEAGEFTFRAFLAGRLDLTQCEAILGVIHAQSERCLDTALSQLAGGLHFPIQSLRTNLLNLLADLEAGLDFVDESIAFVTGEEVERRLEQAQQELASLLLQWSARIEHQRRPSVVLVGPPNAGKSSLVNGLCGQVAIVTAQAGTTRDFVRAPAANVEVDLIDTAGWEPIEDHELPLQPQGMAQQMTHAQFLQADLRWWCIDLTQDHQEMAEQIQAAASTELHSSTWLIGTKCDGVDPSQVSQFCELAGASNLPYCLSSSLEPTSLRQLEQRLGKWLEQMREESSILVPATLQRCESSLRQAHVGIQAALEAARSHAGDEWVSAELRMALYALGQVGGEVYTDDLLDAIFTRFCIGK